MPERIQPNRPTPFKARAIIKYNLLILLKQPWFLYVLKKKNTPNAHVHEIAIAGKLTNNVLLAKPAAILMMSAKNMLDAKTVNKAPTITKPAKAKIICNFFILVHLRICVIVIFVCCGVVIM